MATNHKMNILEFCALNKIKTLPVNIKIIKDEKIYLTGYKGKFRDGTKNFTINDFDKYSYEECCKFTNKYTECKHIFIDTTDIHHFDVDCKTIYPLIIYSYYYYYYYYFLKKKNMYII